MFHHHFYLPEVDIQVHNDHWVLSRIVTLLCLKCTVLAVPKREYLSIAQSLFSKLAQPFSEIYVAIANKSHSSNNFYLIYSSSESKPLPPPKPQLPAPKEPETEVEDTTKSVFLSKRWFAYLLAKFFVKSQRSLLDFCHLTIFFFNIMNPNIFLWL